MMTYVKELCRLQATVQMWKIIAIVPERTTGEEESTPLAGKPE